MEVRRFPYQALIDAEATEVVQAAMFDRIVHHADVLTLKGSSYRLRGRGVDSLPSVMLTTDDKS